MFDVLVAGAGPAGNITALRLSKMGHSVAVVDWRNQPGDKLCTGIVGRECVKLYPPSDTYIRREARSVKIVTPSGESHRISKNEPQAYIIDRVAYVNSIAEEARSSGVEYKLGEKITETKRSQRGVDICTYSPAGYTRYEARLIIIASGFGSPLVTMMGLGEAKNTEYMMGYQAEVEIEPMDDTEVYLGHSVAPGSFGWLVPFSGTRALVGMVSSQKLDKHLEHFMSSLTRSGKITSILKKPKRWGIPLRPIQKTYGDRVLAVGDAAGFVKPTTGGGIYYSLLSGEAAAEIAHSALISNDFSTRKLKHFENRWRADFGKELQIGYYARRLFENLTDSQIERLVKLCISNDVQNELLSLKNFSFDWHSNVILKAMAHRELGKVIRSFSPLVAPLISKINRLPLI